MGLIVGILALMTAWVVVALAVYLLFHFRWSRHAASSEHESGSPSDHELNDTHRDS